MSQKNEGNYNSQFFQNRNCEYFPCHKNIKEEDFNCLFCFCPLYALGKECGGNYIIVGDNIKDCSNCVLPHQKCNYQHVMKKASELVAKVTKETKN